MGRRFVFDDECSAVGRPSVHVIYMIVTFQGELTIWA